MCALILTAVLAQGAEEPLQQDANQPAADRAWLDASVIENVKGTVKVAFLIGVLAAHSVKEMVRPSQRPPRGEGDWPIYTGERLRTCHGFAHSFACCRASTHRDAPVRS